MQPSMRINLKIGQVVLMLVGLVACLPGEPQDGTGETNAISMTAGDAAIRSGLYSSPADVKRCEELEAVGMATGRWPAIRVSTPIQLRNSPRHYASLEEARFDIRSVFSTVDATQCFVNALEVVGQEAILDHATQLMWAKNASKPLPWSMVDDFILKVNSGELAEFDDWRLPTAEEIASLIDSVAFAGSHLDRRFGAVLRNFWVSDKSKQAGDLSPLSMDAGASPNLWDTSLKQFQVNQVLLVRNHMHGAGKLNKILQSQQVDFASRHARGKKPLFIVPSDAAIVPMVAGPKSDLTEIRACEQMDRDAFEQEARFPEIRVFEVTTLRSEPLEFRTPPQFEEMLFSTGVPTKRGYTLCFVNAFTVREKTYITDHATNLMWKTPRVSKEMEEYESRNWNEAQAYVAEANRKMLGEVAGWRLPTMEELASVVTSLYFQRFELPFLVDDKSPIWTSDWSESEDQRYSWVLSGKNFTALLRDDPERRPAKAPMVLLVRTLTSQEKDLASVH